jgi:hypothetical protein
MLSDILAIVTVCVAVVIFALVMLRPRKKGR